MSDVFNRLYKDSTSGARVRSSLRSSQQKKIDSTQWDLKLAAECRLVESKPLFKLANKPVQVSSLSTQNLSPKSTDLCRARTAPTTPRLNQSQLRPISVIMSTDGSIERTDWYYITDSVEPPPYNGPKPKKTQLTSPNKGIPEAEVEANPVPEIELDKYKKELRRLKRNKVVWSNCTNSSESACDHGMPTSMKTKKMKKKKKQIDIVDMNNPINITKKPKAMNVVSYACRSWEHNGYPNSLSFLLEK